MISTVFFWMEGTVVSSLAQAATDRVQGALGGDADASTRMEIIDLATQMNLGRVDGLSFCQSVVDLVQVPMNAEDLAATIQADVQPIPGMHRLLQDLKEAYNLWLIATCPSDWLETIRERVEVLKFFPADAIVQRPESGLKRLVPDVLELAQESAGAPTESCLFVARKSAITTAAVNLSLNAIIFADARRLRRELAMRKLLPPV
jgi:phosphoglycolate phosphatase-like HAD superfamily hydrolase